MKEKILRIKIKSVSKKERPRNAGLTSSWGQNSTEYYKTSIPMKQIKCAVLGEVRGINSITIYYNNFNGGYFGVGSVTILKEGKYTSGQVLSPVKFKKLVKILKDFIVFRTNDIEHVSGVKYKNTQYLDV